MHTRRASHASARPVNCGVIRHGEPVAMICTQCKKPYLSGATPGESPTSLFGLCEACGTTPRFRGFASSLGYSATICVLSVEFALLSWLLQGWWFFAVAAASTIGLYAGLTLLVRRRERVRYRTEQARKRAEWAQNRLGDVLGLLLGLGWLWVALTWGR
jgi:hypothetical protein